jgi:hypothetical protein
LEAVVFDGFGEDLHLWRLHKLFEPVDAQNELPRAVEQGQLLGRVSGCSQAINGKKLAGAA